MPRTAGNDTRCEYTCSVLPSVQGGRGEPPARQCSRHGVRGVAPDRGAVMVAWHCQSRRLSAPLSCLVLALLSGAAGAGDKPVKAFILAGQSNMEGQGFIKADLKRNGGKGSLEHLTKDKATADKFKRLLD